MVRDKIMSLSYVMAPSSDISENELTEIDSSQYYCHNRNDKHATSSLTSSNYGSGLLYPPLSIRQDQRFTSDDYSFGTGSGFATVLERRKRNKTASAKYRQKKNEQQTEMKKKIDQLTERDNILKHQLIALLLENQKIKRMNDNLQKEIQTQRAIFDSNELHDQIHTTYSKIDTWPPTQRQLPFREYYFEAEF